MSAKLPGRAIDMTRFASACAEGLTCAELAERFGVSRYVAYLRRRALRRR